MLLVNSAISIYGVLGVNSLSPKKQATKFTSAEILKIVSSKLYPIENWKTREQIV